MNGQHISSCYGQGGGGTPLTGQGRPAFIGRVKRKINDHVWPSVTNKQTLLYTDQTGGGGGGGWLGKQPACTLVHIFT